MRKEDSNAELVKHNMKYIHQTENKSVEWNGKIIALDIGGVCVSLHFEKCYEALELEDGSPQITMLIEVGKQLGYGRINESDWLDVVSAILGGRFSQSYIRDAWNMILGPAIPGMKDAVEFLYYSKGYRFAYLADTSSTHIAHFFKTNEFCHLVSDGIFSYEEGVRKPNAKMYKTFENKLGIPYFYTDDTQENIAAAVARGWHAEHFTNAEKFLESVLVLGDF